MFFLALASGFSCRKQENDIIKDPSSRLSFSTDSVLFDTVFTTIGSSTRHFQIVNKNNKRIRISSITLERGESSPFFLNVDGTSGKSFTDIEIAANDSIYVFVQVKIDPHGSGNEFIVTDKIVCNTNGNVQSVVLEAWGQDAYYHYPKRAIHFEDGTYLPYSLVDTLVESYTKVGDVYVWKNDKPHVIYGYLVVDSSQKLTIPAGTEVYLNYKAGLWVYRYGELKVQGKKGQEVLFQGARRERDFIDRPGQWDRIWINEGSDNNVIDYAIIKDGFIGVQAELFDPGSFLEAGRVTITNTRIQNMSKWGLYGFAFKVFAANTVISNCQEHCLNMIYGGVGQFYHCTFVNNWKQGKVREVACVNINNYSDKQVLEHAFYFGNCIIDGNRTDELNVDLKGGGSVVPSYTFSSSWIKTTDDISASPFKQVRKDNSSLKYKDPETYQFQLKPEEARASGFDSQQAKTEAAAFPLDLEGKPRNTNSVTAGAYER